MFRHTNETLEYIAKKDIQNEIKKAFEEKSAWPAARRYSHEEWTLFLDTFRRGIFEQKDFEKSDTIFLVYPAREELGFKLARKFFEDKFRAEYKYKIIWTQLRLKTGGHGRTQASFEEKVVKSIIEQAIKSEVHFMFLISIKDHKMEEIRGEALQATLDLYKKIAITSALYQENNQALSSGKQHVQFNLRILVADLLQAYNQLTQDITPDRFDDEIKNTLSGHWEENGRKWIEDVKQECDLLKNQLEQRGIDFNISFTPWREILQEARAIYLEFDNNLAALEAFSSRTDPLSEQFSRAVNRKAHYHHLLFTEEGKKTHSQLLAERIVVCQKRCMENDPEILKKIEARNRELCEQDEIKLEAQNILGYCLSVEEDNQSLLEKINTLLHKGKRNLMPNSVSRRFNFVPSKRAYLMPRTKLLKKINEQFEISLQEVTPHKLLCLYGIGGAGKTTLAILYHHWKERCPYAGTIWIEGRFVKLSKQNYLEKYMQQFALQLGLPENTESPREIRKGINTFLHGKKNPLLIVIDDVLFDSFDEETAFNKFILDILPYPELHTRFMNNLADVPSVETKSASISPLFAFPHVNTSHRRKGEIEEKIIIDLPLDAEENKYISLGYYIYRFIKSTEKWHVFVLTQEEWKEEIFEEDSDISQLLREKTVDGAYASSEEIKRYLLQHLIQTTSRCRILLTSRSRLEHPLPSHHLTMAMTEISGMEREEARSFLLSNTRLPQKNIDHAQKIAEKFGFLPLIVSLIKDSMLTMGGVNASKILSSDISLSDYMFYSHEPSDSLQIRACFIYKDIKKPQNYLLCICHDVGLRRELFSLTEIISKTDDATQKRYLLANIDKFVASGVLDRSLIHYISTMVEQKASLEDIFWKFIKNIMLVFEDEKLRERDLNQVMTKSKRLIKDILYACSFVSTNSIRLATLKTWFENYYTLVKHFYKLDQYINVEKIFNAIKSELIKKALLSYDDKNSTLSMHMVIQEVLQHKLKKEQQEYIDRIIYSFITSIICLNRTNANKYELNADQEVLISVVRYAKSETLCQSLFDFFTFQLSSSSIGNVRELTRTTSSSNSIAAHVRQDTKGEGDCAFHAALGRWNPNTQQFEIDDIASKRRRVSDAVKESQLTPDLLSFIKSAIMTLVMDHNTSMTGEAYQRLTAAYQNFETSDNQLIAEKWAIFEPKLLQHRAIIQHIQCFIEAYIEKQQRDSSVIVSLSSSLRDRFFTCQNEGDDTLRALIMSIPELEKAYLDYKKLAQGINFDDLLNDPALFNEYAVFISTPGRWLLPCELAIIAHVFDISIEYYTMPTAAPDHFNPGRPNQVAVCFNGRDHYERMTDETALSSSTRVSDRGGADGNAEFSRHDSTTDGATFSVELEKSKVVRVNSRTFLAEANYHYICEANSLLTYDVDAEINTWRINLESRRLDINQEIYLKKNKRIACSGLKNIVEKLHHENLEKAIKQLFLGYLDLVHFDLVDKIAAVLNLRFNNEFFSEELEASIKSEQSIEELLLKAIIKKYFNTSLLLAKLRPDLNSIVSNGQTLIYYIIVEAGNLDLTKQILKYTNFNAKTKENFLKISSKDLQPRSAETGYQYHKTITRIDNATKPAIFHHNYACYCAATRRQNKAEKQFEIALQKEICASSFVVYAIFLMRYQYNNTRKIQEFLANARSLSHDSDIDFETIPELLDKTLTEEMQYVKNFKIAPWLLATWLLILFHHQKKDFSKAMAVLEDLKKHSDSNPDKKLPNALLAHAAGLLNQPSLLIATFESIQDPSEFLCKRMPFDAKTSHKISRNYALKGQKIKAFSYCKKAALDGYVYAMVIFAGHYAVNNLSWTFATRKEKILFWSKKIIDHLQELHARASQNNAEAQYILAVCYYSGLGVAVDYNKAFYFAMKASEQGHVCALNFVGYCFDYERSVTKSEKKANYYYQLAAVENNAVSQRNLSLNLKNQDENSSLNWLKKSSHSGHPRSQYEWAEYLSKQCTNVTREIFDLYRKAADNHHELAQLKMAEFYENGMLVEKNIEMAEIFYKKAESNLSEFECIYKVKGINAGRNTWYYIFVKARCINKFLHALNDSIIHLENYGKILYSAYGDEPSQKITDDLKKKYDIKDDDSILMDFPPYITSAQYYSFFYDSARIYHHFTQEEYLINHRHNNPMLQHLYDQRFGLTTIRCP